MNTDVKPDPEQAMRDWWRTGIIDMKPGMIRCRGYAIEELTVA
jgi:citrate synthase